jgi:soluble lytic murein transglycosylase
LRDLPIDEALERFFIHLAIHGAAAKRGGKGRDGTGQTQHEKPLPLKVSSTINGRFCLRQGLFGRFKSLFLGLACCLILLGVPASASPLSSSDAAIYREAFAFISAGKGAQALQLAGQTSDRTLTDVVAGAALVQDDSVYDFGTYVRFLNEHRDWPEADRRAIASAAEKHMGASENPNLLYSFFSTYPPQTGDGFAHYAAVLRKIGQEKTLGPLVRKHWRERLMGKAEQEFFQRNFAAHLSRGDIHQRLDYMLWEGLYAQAVQLYPLLTPAEMALAKARMALAQGTKNAPHLVSKVPANFKNDPGLLYERARWRVKHNDEAGALELIHQAGARPPFPEEWWNVRQPLVRWLMSKGDFTQAYRLAAAHGMETGKDYVEAEFLAGFLALRFLNQPKTALPFFQHVSAKGNGPISLARGAYWSGRAYEALGDQANAQASYQRALQSGTTFYGQLAAGKLYPQSRISAETPTLSADTISRFENSNAAIRVQQLLQIGEKPRAERFALAFVDGSRSETDYRLMAIAGMEAGHPDMAVKICKAAAKKQVLLTGEGYPVIQHASDLPQAALVHALIRQESQFDAGVVSPSNAQGLMQLLPSTAKHVNNKHGLGVDPENLFDPATNVQLGNTYINEMLTQFNGSLPLAIAAYNAGPGRVRQWLGTMGSPQGLELDAAVDWLERIPYAETRNYVQRVLEALQIYRAKFAGGTAYLTLPQDIEGRENVTASAQDIGQDTSNDPVRGQQN